MPLSLALVGCGNMGQALLTGWLQHQVPYDISVIQPDPLPSDYTQNGYSYYDHLLDKKSFDIIIFAVKPQILDEVVKGYAKAVHEQTLIISIAAGKSIQTFEKFFGEEQPIIRVMPNTPAAVGKGISALVSNSITSEEQKAIAEGLFKSSGQTIWLDDEHQMDAVTAISGSGPAYLFYFIEAFATAAEKAGLNPEISEILARQTIIGAAALAENQDRTSAETLRQNVTSPKGTTEAALNILMDGDFQKKLTEAVLAAKSRSEELKS